MEVPGNFCHRICCGLFYDHEIDGIFSLWYTLAQRIPRRDGIGSRPSAKGETYEKADIQLPSGCAHARCAAADGGVRGREHAQGRPVTGGNIYVDMEKGEVVDCDNTVTEMIVPEQVDGVTIQAISDRAFQERKNLKRVTLPGHTAVCWILHIL